MALSSTQALKALLSSCSLVQMLAGEQTSRHVEGMSGEKEAGL